MTTENDGAVDLVGQGDFRYEPLPGWDQLPADWSYGEVVGAATDSAGNLYAFNRGEHPVIVYSADGTCQGSWGEGQFQRPHGIWLTNDDQLWLSDDHGHCVRRYTTDGQRLQTLGTEGVPSDTGVVDMDYRTLKQPAGPFNLPTNLAVAPDGRLFVTDGYGNCRVHRFSAEGEHETSWGTPGAGPGQFHLPHGIDVDSAGVVFVCDRENSRIQLFDSDGGFLEEWTDVARPCEVFLDADDTVYVAELGWHAGTNDQRFDETGGRISIFSRQGELLSRFGGGSDPYAPGDFAAPHDIWVDSQGDIYTSEVIASAAVPRGLVGPDCPTLQKFRKI
ncbi:MAG: peptidyl-alpha-hydroxyglycine alpha-amidating lyase family protein [Planctomycetaceae bacterium]